MNLQKCVVIVSTVILSCSSSFQFEELGGDKPKRSEPFTRHKMVRCFDENVKILGPKNFEVEKHNTNEETKMSITRQKRGAGCVIETIHIDEENPGVKKNHPRIEHVRDNYPDKKNFNPKNPSDPLEKNFNTRRYFSDEIEVSSRNEMSGDNSSPVIPNLPSIPHIGHEATFPIDDRSGRDKVGPDTVVDGEFDGDGEPELRPLEKTISFKTNTRRQETVDQTGFLREKTNGYPIRSNEKWRDKFKEIPYRVDENGRVVDTSGASNFYDINLISVKIAIAFIVRYAIYGIIL
ncbi:uncharacterized protein LOC125501988 [Athalia rosae]|uniref:uncharacterized protein LOC125501988 n=1 Tax=Athalia rosae TaxID=37344 RepID=UPI0020333F24|nr:uncharacterized protein LOC125501988 [Athalia rosae]